MPSKKKNPGDTHRVTLAITLIVAVPVTGSTNFDEAAQFAKQAWEPADFVPNDEYDIEYMDGRVNVIGVDVQGGWSVLD